LIVAQEGLQDDVVYGKTMLFIRSPQTVHQLETRRAKEIPRLIVMLQKVGRSKYFHDEMCV
jgi:myosin-1